MIFDQDSILRDKDLWKLSCKMALILGAVIIGLYYGVEKPMEDHWNKIIADSKAKSQAEHDKIVLMDCKALGEWLTQDSWFDRDNLVWAQNHYLVNCK